MGSPPASDEQCSILQPVVISSPSHWPMSIEYDFTSFSHWCALPCKIRHRLETIMHRNGVVPAFGVRSRRPGTDPTEHRVHCHAIIHPSEVQAMPCRSSTSDKSFLEMLRAETPELPTGQDQILTPSPNGRGTPTGAIGRTSSRPSSVTRGTEEVCRCRTVLKIGSDGLSSLELGLTPPALAA